ncbi:MAG: response regulator [Planctomycetes bacterium]|nr:response regulator [Planctomycetota bacterium]
MQPRENRRILIVDDNSDIHADFRRILCPAPCVDLAAVEAELFGQPASAAPPAALPVRFELASAYQGQEAEEQLRREMDQGRPFALALVDMRMPPGWDGLTTIRKLWAVDPRLEVVICTAYSDYSWEEIIATLGHGDQLLILKKPFDPIEVRQLALTLTTKWRLSRAAAASRQQLEEAVERRTIELRAAKEAAVRAAESKGQFLANMSHEIRTPLTTILGFTRLLIDGGATVGSDESRRYLQIIRTSAEHQLGLVNDILDLAKIEAGRMSVHSVDCWPRRIVEEVLAALEHRAAEKGLKLEMAWPDAAPEVIRSDPARLRQLLLNLVGNAVKFTESGGVRVTGQAAQIDGRPMLKLEVIDTGIGIAEEKLNTVFDPFVQADNSPSRAYGGTGLGLTISRKVAAALGGSLNVSSSLGKGSIFTALLDVSLPEPDESAPVVSGDPQRAASAAATHVPSNRRCRLLLVEDNTHNRELISIWLRRAGATVEAAENGKVAVEKALDNHFDAILMDMQMPVMDGYAATRLLRDRGYDRPIVALTAHALDEERERCFAAGCNDLLHKPIDFDRLEAFVKQLEVSGKEAPPQPSSSDWNAPEIAADNDLEFRAVVEDYAASLAGTLAEVRRAAAQRDWPRVCEIAHSLKGSGGTLGFPAVTEIAIQLESAARRAADAQVAAAIRRFEDLIAGLPADRQVAVVRR